MNVLLFAFLLFVLALVVIAVLGALWYVACMVMRNMHN